MPLTAPNDGLVDPRARNHRRLPGQLLRAKRQHRQPEQTLMDRHHAQRAAPKRAKRAKRYAGVVKRAADEARWTGLRDAEPACLVLLELAREVSGRR